MDKKAIIVIMILLIIAIGTVFFFLLKPKGYQSYFNEEYEKCMELNQQKYYQAMARKTRDTTYCDKLSAEGKEDCISLLNKDTSVCNEYPEEKQNTCRARILQNPELCKPFDFWCMAYASEEEKYCEYLEDEESKKECINYLRKNAEYYISGQAEQACKDSAYVNAAMQTNDASVCNKIMNPEIKQSCLDAF